MLKVKLKNLINPSFLSVLIALLCFLFVKPWDDQYEKSLISWDKLGYYLYLPVSFIYKDWNTLSFVSYYFNLYQPTSYWYQSLTLENGNQVISFPLGVALLQLPFFILGHISALLFNYKADGFSTPYVVWIYISGLFYSCIGIYYIYKSLIFFYSERLSRNTLFLLFTGTNLFFYCFIDTITPHSYLFALYSILIYFTIRWHQFPSFSRSLIICFSIGLMVSIRATEIISIFIPVFWSIYNIDSLKRKFGQLFKNYKQLVVGIAISTIPFLLQMIYWKYATGHFIFNPYFYKGLAFSWLNPYAAFQKNI